MLDQSLPVRHRLGCLLIGSSFELLGCIFVSDRVLVCRLMS